MNVSWSARGVGGPGIGDPERSGPDPATNRPPRVRLAAVVARAAGFLAAALVGLLVAVTVARPPSGGRPEPLGRPGLLVAARNGELMLVDATGAVVRRTPTGDIIGIGAWSHDGTRIAFEGGGMANPALVVADAQLHELLRIPLPVGSVPFFSWSPDDRRIAFSQETLEYAQVDVIDVAAGAIPNPVTDPEENARSPHWSPDGTLISVRAGYDSDDQALYVMTPDGSNLTLVSGRVRPVDQFCGGWAPDGRSLVFGTRGADPAVWTVARDGTNLRRLTAAALDGSCPSISPDGSRIAAAVTVAGRRAMAVMRLDGSGLVMPDGPTSDEWPGIWSPDGRSLVVNGRAAGDAPGPRAFVDPAGRSTARTFFLGGASIVDWQRLAP